MMIVGIWIEKGMGLIVPAFVPSPLGEIVSICPRSTSRSSPPASGPSDCSSTILVRITVPVLSGELTHDGPRTAPPGEASLAAGATHDDPVPDARVRPPVAARHIIERARRPGMPGRDASIARRSWPCSRTAPWFGIPSVCGSTPVRSAAPEFAVLEPLGDHPRDGFCLSIHPALAGDDELLPLLIAYYIPSVNYGDVAGHTEAELFGSTLLGLDTEAYYRVLCAVADAMPDPGAVAGDGDPRPAPSATSCGDACGCRSKLPTSEDRRP